MNSDDSKKVESSMKKCDELIRDMKEDVEEIDGVKTKIGILLKKIKLVFYKYL